jgi:hypothetical protein
MDKPDVINLSNRLEISISHAKKLVRLLGTVQKHLKSGALPDARTSFRPCVELTASVTESFAQIGADLNAPLAQYLQSSEYFADVSVKCKELGLELRDDEDTWYCFPSTIKVLAKEEVVVINTIRTSEILPASIADKLRKAYDTAIANPPKQFLDVLFKAYLAIGSKSRPHTEMAGAVVPVVDLYNVLTLWPERKRQYSKSQFALDLYLLDRSGVTSVSGNRLTFSASTGARDRSKIVAVQDEHGYEKVYYGISFVDAGSGSRNE